MTDSGIFRSLDSGATWNRAKVGPKCPTVNAIIASGGDLVAGTSTSGIVLSKDSGQNWESSNKGLTNTYVKSLAGHRGALVAGTPLGAFRSLDMGVSWSEANDGLGSSYIKALDTLGPFLFACTMNGVFRSSNGGLTWSRESTGQTDLYASYIFVNGRRIFVTVTGYATTIIRSDDSGKTWVKSSNGVTNTTLSNIAADSSYFYLGSLGGVYRSSDGGLSWSPLAALNFKNITFENLLAFGRVVFAETATQILRSDDNGVSWVPVDLGVSFNRIYCLSLVRGSLVVGTDSGSYFSRDSGKTWLSIRGNLQVPIVTLAESNGDYLFVSTGGVGLSRRSLADFSTGIVSQNRRLSKTGFLNHPRMDPTGALILEFQTTEISPIWLDILDAQGKILAQLVSAEVFPAGIHVLRRAVVRSGGVYIIRLRTQGEVHTTIGF